MAAGWMGAGGVKGRGGGGWGGGGSAREMGADRKERLYLCLEFGLLRVLQRAWWRLWRAWWRACLHLGCVGG